MIKLSICILFFIIGIQTSQAQWEKEDSLRLKRMLEGKEEIKINEEAVKSIQFYFLPEEELHRRSPILSDEKPWMKFITKLPTEFIKGWKYKNTMEIKMDMNFEIPQTSTALATFDADKFLFENFTKRGRAIKRNRKHALAWKTYNDSTTHKDSLDKYENKKRIPKDTLAIACDTLK